MNHVGNCLDILWRKNKTAHNYFTINDGNGHHPEFVVSFQFCNHCSVPRFECVQTVFWPQRMQKSSKWNRYMNNLNNIYISNMFPTIESHHLQSLSPWGSAEGPFPLKKPVWEWPAGKKHLRNPGQSWTSCRDGLRNDARWCPPSDVCWFISPNNYRYIYHKS
jgi:hypothetical protein